MKYWPKISTLLFFAVLLFFPPNGSSCGPDFPSAIFFHEKHPGVPLSWYADGNLGIVQPDFDRAYLVIAYRHFSGRPLAKSERSQMLNYFRWAVGSWSNVETQSDPVKDWRAARGEVAVEEPQTTEPGTEQRVRVGNYESFSNCLDDAFRTATATLRDRMRRFGDDRASIQEWIHGQDMVFSNCDALKDVPGRVSEGSPQWLKADRDYQIAAGFFYARWYDGAAEKFDRIAGDTASPWRELSPYLAARAMIRKGTVADQLDKDALRNAETRLRNIVNDPAQRTIHEKARAMLGLVSLRLDPQQRSAELAKRLSGPQPDPDFYQDVIDYKWSLERGLAESLDFGGVKLRTNEMTDWIFTFESAFEVPHAIERWRTTRSLPWLVAAISKIGAKDPAMPELVAAAAKVTPTSPAYVTLLYHRVRLEMQAGANDKARALLDSFLQSPPQRLTASSRNLLLNQRMRAAASYEDFLSHAPRLVISLDEGTGIGAETPFCETKACDSLLFGSPDKKKSQLRFDRDGAWTLNLRLPLELLKRAATGAELPEPLRGEVALAAWTRAAILDQQDIAAALTPEVEKAYPVMKDQLEAFVAAKPEQRKDAATFVMLHFPGMRPYVNAGVARTTEMEKIDNYRDNWWCVDVGAAIDETNFEKTERWWNRENTSGRPRAAPEPVPFLSPDQRKAAAADWQTLSASGAGSSYLTRQTLAWAKANPDDPRIPEALHLAVRSTHYGCTDADTTKLSRAAFTLLHEKYPTSKWAKQTPYWY